MNDVADAKRFRVEVRDWLKRNLPAEMRQPMSGEQDICWGGRRFVFQSDAQRAWMEAMASRGWTVPTWPQEYGGAALSAAHAAILGEELKNADARPPLSSLGIWMLGPALLKYGTEQQKRKHLPPIARGEVRWCQGYSEPSAGSDLASLRTRATDQGDHFLVDGQKTWTSYGDKADWMFCLVRTDQKAAKHAGISFLLFDMTTPGVEARPIELISGASNFSDVFLDSVHVPKENLVGELNQGWDVAKYLLEHERSMIATLSFRPAETETLAEAALRRIGKGGSMLAEPMLRTAIAQDQIDTLALSFSSRRAVDESAAGSPRPISASMLKYLSAEFNKRRARLAMVVAGTSALEWQAEADQTAQKWLRSYGAAIAGGTSEIQLNIIAKRELELPNG